MATSACDLLSCTLAWDSSTPADLGSTVLEQGSSTLEAAVIAALEALDKLQPPAPATAAAFKVPTWLEKGTHRTSRPLQTCLEGHADAPDAQSKAE